MTDIVTGWNATQGFGDWLLGGNEPALWVDGAGNPIVDEGGAPIGVIDDSSDRLQSAGDLATAVLISLFTDAAADDDDTIADGTENRRGWWGGNIGSKLWLRQREKPTPQLLALVKSDIVDALDWLIQDGVAARIDVATEYTRPGMLGAQVTIHRSGGRPLTLRFASLWDSL